LFLKGNACCDELKIAKESWVFLSSQSQSITHATGCVLRLTEIKYAS